MADKKSNTEKRARHWSFIVYPESAPPDWRSIIDETHVEWVESPLHDKDVDPDGEIKKPHWHIIVMYEGVKSFEQIKEITDKLNSPIPQKVASAKGMVRYFVHMDNPEKHQYDRKQIIAHGGADITELLKPPPSVRYVLISEMTSHVKAEGITEFCDLFDYAAEQRPDDWLPLLCDSCAYIVGQYIKSVRHKIQIQKEKDDAKRRPKDLTDDELKRLKDI